MTKPISFNPWEIQYLEQLLNRWHDYKGTGSFSIEEHSMVESIQKKVQMVSTLTILFTPNENNFLQSLIYRARADYGRGSGNSVFETGVRNQVQQRTVQLMIDILAKLRGTIPEIINPGETEAIR